MIHIGDLVKITRSTNADEIGKMCLVLNNPKKDVFHVQIIETGTKHLYPQTKLIRLGDQK